MLVSCVSMSAWLFIIIIYVNKIYAILIGYPCRVLMSTMVVHIMDVNKMNVCQE